jgi:putative intracellular protease/amidase
VQLHKVEQLGAKESLRGGVVHAVCHRPVRVAHAKLDLRLLDASQLLGEQVAQLEQVDSVAAHLHGSVLTEQRVAEEVDEVHGIKDGRLGHAQDLAVDGGGPRGQPSGRGGGRGARGVGGGLVAK